MCDSSSATARAESVPCPPLSFGRLGNARLYISSNRFMVPARFLASTANLAFFCAAGSEPALASPFSLFATSRATSGDNDAGLPNTIDLDANLFPVSGSTPRGLYSNRHAIEVALTMSASPLQSASLRIVRWAGSRFFQAASITARVILTGPCRSTCCLLIVTPLSYRTDIGRTYTAKLCGGKRTLAELGPIRDAEHSPIIPVC